MGFKPLALVALTLRLSGPHLHRNLLLLLHSPTQCGARVAKSPKSEMPRVLLDFSCPSCLDSTNCPGLLGFFLLPKYFFPTLLPLLSAGPSHYPPLPVVGSRTSVLSYLKACPTWQPKGSLKGTRFDHTSPILKILPYPTTVLRRKLKHSGRTSIHVLIATYLFSLICLQLTPLCWSLCSGSICTSVYTL